MTRWCAVLCASVIVAGCGMTTPSPAAVRTPDSSPASPSTSATPTDPLPTGSPPAPSTTPTAGPTATPVATPVATPSATPVPPGDRWVKAGRFTDQRMDTQLAVLGTGEVLAAGDEATCGIENAASDTAELWRPDPPRWTATDQLPSARTMTTLIALADGRAMVMGGANEAYVAKSGTAVYDPGTHRWTVSGLLGTARMSFGAAPLSGGGALVAGGLFIGIGQDGHGLRDAETWDPMTDSWTGIAPLSSVRVEAVAATLADGRVLSVGGYPKWGAETPLATAELYDPSSREWRSAGELTTPRVGFSLVALPGGGALVVGGQRGEDRAERFDPDTGTWTMVCGAAPTGERPTAIALRDGRVLVVSGSVTKLYDPTADRWRGGPSLPGGMSDASAVALPDGSVLVGGGWTTPPAPGDTPGCPGYDERTWRFVPEA